jgi:hypothetical protein
MKFRKSIAIIVHSWRQIFATLIIIFTLGVFYSYKLASLYDQESWWSFLDPLTSITTAAVSLFVLRNQWIQRWENQLEQRLDVDYVYIPADSTHLPIIQVQGAYLSGQDDIRQWSQQLGRQIVSGDLEFDMNWDDEPMRIEYDDNENKFIKQHKVTMYLRENVVEKYKDNINKFKDKMVNSKYSEVITTTMDGIITQVIWKRKAFMAEEL